MAEKYRFSVLSRSTTFTFVTPLGAGALGSDPSSGIGSDSDIAGASCAAPKMYGMNE